MSFIALEAERLSATSTTTLLSERGPLRGFSATRSRKMVARLCTTARRRSNAPSTPYAANFAASSLNPNAEPVSYPQNPQTRLNLK
jgi:hypothetical protein